MSLFMGYENDDYKYLSKEGGTLEEGELDMDFHPLRNIATPTEDDDAISKKYFLRNSRGQTVLYKYLGIATLNTKRLPDYIHGNHRGCDILHSDGYTDKSTLYLHDILFDSDSKDYDLKFKFYARLIYKDKAVVDYDISNGGIELKSLKKYDISFNASSRSSTVARWIDLGLKIKIRNLTAAPEDVRFILILIEQLRGHVGGQ